MTLLLVSNIPSDLTVSDLRDFFHEEIEAGEFACFHYTHRRAAATEAVGDSKELASYMRKERERDRQRALRAFVRDAQPEDFVDRTTPPEERQRRRREAQRARIQALAQGRAR